MTDSDSVLLIDPVASAAPPLDLLRQATAFRRRGLWPILRRGLPDPTWSGAAQVVITGVFSWDFPVFEKAVAAAHRLWPSALITLSGVLPRRLGKKLGEALNATVLDEETESALDVMPPDYSLIPEWDASIVITSKGVCPRECSHCDAAWRRKGVSRIVTNWTSHIEPRLPRIEVWDNTLMLTERQHFESVADVLTASGKPVDFVCGLTPDGVQEPELKWRLKRMRDVRVAPVRLECNRTADLDRFHRMMSIASQFFAGSAEFRAFALINAVESPDIAWSRLERMEAAGAVVEPVVYTPHDWLTTEPYVFRASGWSVRHIQSFRQRWAGQR